MIMTDKLFSQETPDNKPSPEVEDQKPEDKAPTVDPEQLLFKVGDREYNAESAAKDIAHKQAFIDQVLQEKRELEERLEKDNKSSSKLDEALELLKQKQQIQDNDPSQETETVDTESLEEQLRKIAQEEAASTYQSTEAENKAQANLQKSVSTAKEVYGEDYQTKLEERRKALGMSEEDAMSMAKSNPDAFRELFARKVEPTPQPQQSRNTTSYRSRNKDLEIPRITGYFARETSVNKLREAEQAMKTAYEQGKLDL